MSQLSRITLILCTASLTACAGTASNTRPKPTGHVDENAVNTLVTQLDSDSRRFEAGLALTRSGEAERGEAEIKASLDGLQARAIECGTVAGCDQARFFSAYDRLLRIRVDVPVVDGVDETAPISEEDTTEAGETSPVIVSLPAMERTITLLKGRELADILTINDAVNAGIEQWLTQYRPNLITTYVNYEFMRYRMWPEYHKAGLPEALLFGMLAKESNGRVHAVSRAGASGPLQFMYATGLRFGLSAQNGFDQRFDPGLSARANAAYINEQLEVFNGNLELVIAAYNGGEGRMRRLAAQGGSTSFWDPKIYSIMPDETRDYVPMVLAASWLFLHPERYNLKFPKIDGRPGKIELTAPATLAELTVCFGSEGDLYEGWFRALRNLNPAIDPQQELPVGTRLEVPASLQQAYAGSCAGGKWAALAKTLNVATNAMRPAQAVASAKPAASRTYVVRSGDNLAAIARKNGCAANQIRDIARLNNIRGPHYPIKAGQRLQLPVCGRN